MIDTPAQGMSAGTDETLQAAQGEARQPGPKDAPGTQGNPTPTDVNTLIERLEANAEDYTGSLQCEAAQALRAMQARVGELEQIAAWVAKRPTIDEVMRGGLAAMSPEERIRRMGERKREHDQMVLLARSTQQEAQRHGE